MQCLKSHSPNRPILELIPRCSPRGLGWVMVQVQPLAEIILSTLTPVSLTQWSFQVIILISFHVRWTVGLIPWYQMTRDSSFYYWSVRLYHVLYFLNFPLVLVYLHVPFIADMNLGERGRQIWPGIIWGLFSYKYSALTTLITSQSSRNHLCS